MGTGLTCEEVVIGQTGGRPSGEAYARLATKEQAAQALELNRKMMGSRWGSVLMTNSRDYFFWFSKTVTSFSFFKDFFLHISLTWLQQKFRYIEIFRTNESDLERHRDRPRAGPYSGPRDFGGKPPSLLSLDYSSGQVFNHSSLL